MLKRTLAGFIVIACCFLQMSCRNATPELEFVSLMYPDGEDDLRIWKNGEASLYYGPSPHRKIIRTGTFQIESFYETLRPHLYPVVPREEWPDPTAEAGMVHVRFLGQDENAYLIFNAQEVAQDIFDEAKAHIVGERW